MVRHYIKYICPGILFAEYQEKEVQDRNVDINDIPAEAEGFCFYDIDTIEQYDKKLESKPYNFSGWFYLGRKLNKDDVAREFGTDSTLYSNMKHNDFHFIVQTRHGSCYFLNEDDEVIS